jgi:hypothetical protein
MANINLAFEDSDQEKQRTKLLSKNTIISLVVLFSIFCLYGALMIVSGILSKKIEQAKEQYGTEYVNFIQSNANEVADFKNRSATAKKLIDEDNQPMNEILSKIENGLVTSVYLTKYAYNKEDKTISLSCIGDNFNIMAKQILSFKENENFSSVVSGEGAIDSKNSNKVNFSLVLKIK